MFDLKEYDLKLQQSLWLGLFGNRNVSWQSKEEEKLMQSLMAKNRVIKGLYEWTQTPQ